MLADLPVAREPMALEHRHRAVVEEGARHGAVVGVLGIALHRDPAEARDLLERPRERGAGDPAVAMRASYEEARDASVGQLPQGLAVGLLVFDAR